MTMNKAVHCRIARNYWKQPNYITKGAWLYKLRHIHRVEYYTAVKKNGGNSERICILIQKDLQELMFSEKKVKAQQHRVFYLVSKKRCVY